QEPHAQPDVLRRQVIELHRIVEIVGPIKHDEVAAARVSEIDIAIRELDRRVAPDLVSQAGVQGPREIPFARAVRIGVRTGAGETVYAGREVAEIADRVATHADAGTDEGRDVPPRAEIDVPVDQEQPFGLACDVTVGSETAARKGPDIHALEVRLAAIFTRYVGA